jgi:hypothetical protein
MFARHKIALIQEQVNRRAGAVHAEACFRFHLLCVTCLDDQDNLSDERNARRSAFDQSTRFCHLRHACPMKTDAEHDQHSPRNQTKALAVTPIEY